MAMDNIDLELVAEIKNILYAILAEIKRAENGKQGEAEKVLETSKG